MRTRGLLMILVLCTGWAAWPMAAHAQGADLPSVAPSACTAEPIDLPVEGDAGDLTQPSPTPTPIDQANTVRADDATVQGVTGTIAMSVACQNAGDELRMLSCFTERWIEERFAGYDLVFYSRFLDAAAQATPIAESRQIELVAVDPVTLRDDGAALATVVTRQDGVELTSLIVLVQDSGAWLIDGAEVRTA